MGGLDASPPRPGGVHSGVCSLVPGNLLERGRGIVAGSKARHESRIPSKSGDSRQQSRMVTGPVRRGQEHEEHMYGLTVHRFVVRPVRTDSDENLRLGDGGADGVRDRYPVPDSGTEDFLPRQEGSQSHLRVLERAAADDRREQLPENTRDVVVPNAEDDSVLRQVLGKSHGALIPGMGPVTRSPPPRRNDEA